MHTNIVPNFYMSFCCVETYQKWQLRPYVKEYITRSSRWEPEHEWKWQNNIQTIWRTRDLLVLFSSMLLRGRLFQDEPKSHHGHRNPGSIALRPGHQMTQPRLDTLK